MDAFDIEVPDRIGLKQPAASGPLSPPPQPTQLPAPTTATRLHINVPAATTQLSLGSDASTTQSGITGRTDTNVQFFAQGVGSDAPTFVSFGTSPNLGLHALASSAAPATATGTPGQTTAAAMTSAGTIATATSVGNGNPLPAGFFVVTGGEATLQAAQDFRIESPTCVTIAADDDIKNFWGNASGWDRFNNLTRYVGNWIERDYQTLASISLAAFALGTSTYWMKHKPNPDKPGWAKADWDDPAASILKAGLIGHRVYKLATKWGTKEKAGRVAIAASEMLCIDAKDGIVACGNSIDMSATMTASFASPVSDFKGYGLATLWGGYKATVQGMKKAVVVADLGPARLLARDFVEVSSKNDRAYVSAMKSVQVNSNDDQVLVHGATGVRLQAGTGTKTTTPAPMMGGYSKALNNWYGSLDYLGPSPGMGIHVLPDGIEIGQLDNATTLDGASVSKVKISLDEDSIALLGPDNTTFMVSDAILGKVGGSMLTVKKDAVTFKGKKVLLEGG